MMPYMIKQVGDKYQVAKKTGEIVGQPHATEEEAKKHLAALEANVEDAHESKRRTGYFAELVDLTEAALVEGEERSVRTTLIRPGWSANGRYYSKTVLGESAKLFEGGKAYADHPSKSELKDKPERSVRDIVGWYDGVKQEADGRLTASLHVVDDKMWPIVEAAVTKNPQLAGVSINALGETRMGEVEGRKGVIVEAIVKHNSTDIVTTPAAGGKFDSLLASDGDSWTRDLIEAMSLVELQETLREVRPDLVKAWQTEWKASRDTEALKAARAEAQSLKTQLAEVEKKHRTDAETLKESQAELVRVQREWLVDRLLTGSKLPAEWRKQIREQLVKAKDENDMKAILESEAKKAASAPQRIQIRGSGSAVSPSVSVSLKPVNPLAEALGVDEKLMGANSIAEYRRMKENLGANK